MKRHSIKFKITLWYTSIMILLFAIVLGSTVFVSDYYNDDNMKKQLIDEVLDMKENASENTSIFYDDGVMISLYTSDGEFIDGLYPDNFPENVPFLYEDVQEIRTNEGGFYVFDSTFDSSDDVWIRGILSYNMTAMFMRHLMIISSFLLPVLIFLIAFVGYRMIKRSLYPIYTISQTVDEIVDSSDLSVRLEVPKIKDEFHYLTDTFNTLLNHLQQQFIREQQFTSDAAHELRTPIFSILSHCEYCLDELELTPETREELLVIRQKSLQMSELISNLLTIARTENKKYRPNFEEVDLEILAETIFDTVDSKAKEKRISLILDNTMDSPVIQADMEMMMRLFTNMIENAISYGHLDGFVKVGITQKNNSVCIHFTDNGIGIPEESLDKIWDRFYQVDQSHSTTGFGLGLFLVKHIVNCHNGNITVQSVVDAGTTFCVTLPINQK